MVETAKGRRRTAGTRAQAAKARKKEAPGQSSLGQRRKKNEAPIEPRGLASSELGGGQPPDAVTALQRDVEEDGGCVLSVYREPLGGHWTILAGLPIERVGPTPFQRDLSQAHVTKLTDVMKRLDRFLDPIIVIRRAEGEYWTPNGHHRLSALRKLGARSVVALVLPDTSVAYSILALNTEKAHNIREKALEVIRMARSLSQVDLDTRVERDFAAEFEEPALLTLGLCYEERGRFSGGPYHAILRQIDAFIDEALPVAIEIRKGRASRLLELDDMVTRAVDALRERGFESPFLKPFVVARINPLRFRRAAFERAAPRFEDTLERMLDAAELFDVDSVRPGEIARASGPLED